MPNRPPRLERAHASDAFVLADRLRTARLERRMSQQSLAAAAQVSIGAVRALEAKRSVDPSFFTVVAIARALGVPIQELVAADQQATARGPLS
ncbi:helix-turn-helix domain-containing protein [Kribbella catacumbae]|uniref:helix-turn-helix domain-containing protein n=1 Tax=Kribbella catacumbae TaxID=460086 RepID=UPI000A05D9DA